MTDYLASKADKEESKSSVAKGDTDGWTTVSRRSIRGRPANNTGKHKHKHRYGISHYNSLKSVIPELQ